MNKKSNEIVRLGNIINGDRLSEKDEFNELFLRDLTKLLYDYFDFNGYPMFSLEKKGSVFKVQIGLTATAIKNFSFLPKR